MRTFKMMSYDGANLKVIFQEENTEYYLDEIENEELLSILSDMMSKGTAAYFYKEMIEEIRNRLQN